MRILVGDVGGTKTLLQLLECNNQEPRGQLVREQYFASQHYPSLAALLEEFIAEGPNEPIDSACLAIAGPVRHTTEGGDEVQLTNLTWFESSITLAQRLQIPQMRLINDFQAIGHGIEALTAGELLTLQEGQPISQAPRLVLGAGTGLGVALLMHDGTRYQPIATEAGHTDFAPASEMAWNLKESLARRHNHVSWERLVSGPGLESIYRYLCTIEPDMQNEALLQGDDIPATISSFAQSGGYPLAEQALDLFVEFFGSFTGNMALTSLPYGGIFIAGGIAPKIKDRMARGDFVAAFRAKGRMVPLLEAMPIHLVTEPSVGVLGAALVARRLHTT